MRSTLSSLEACNWSVRCALTRAAGNVVPLLAAAASISNKSEAAYTFIYEI
jgi:hypothetical protein